MGWDFEGAARPDVYGTDDLNPLQGQDKTVLYGKVYGWRAFQAMTAEKHNDFPLTLRSSTGLATFLYTPVQYVRLDHGSRLEARHDGRARSKIGGIWHNAPYHGTEEVIPVFSCSCGIYVYATLRALMDAKEHYQPRTVKQNPADRHITGHVKLMRRRSSPHAAADSRFVVALVSVAGKVILHERGMRAQYIQLEKLFIDAPTEIKAELRRRYGVKVFNYNSIASMRLPNVHGDTPLKSLQVPDHTDFHGELERWKEGQGG